MGKYSPAPPLIVAYELLLFFHLGLHISSVLLVKFSDSPTQEGRVVLRTLQICAATDSLGTGLVGVPGRGSRGRHRLNTPYLALGTEHHSLLHQKTLSPFIPSPNRQGASSSSLHPILCMVVGDIALPPSDSSSKETLALDLRYSTSLFLATSI